MTYQTENQGGACQVQDVTYHVHGSVTSDATRDKSSVSVRGGTLLVTVAESSSVVSCGEDIVRVASPGAELETAAFEAGTESFTFDLPGTIIGGQRPSLWVQALVDSNENGQCDEGELVGSVELDDGDLGNIALALSDDQGCPARY